MALPPVGRYGGSHRACGRSPSTVSREIKRNGGCSAYRASEADRRAWERALRRSLVAWRHAELDGASRRSSRSSGRLCRSLGWLKRQFPADQGMQVSHEAIYRSLFIQTRGVLKKELMAHLRTARQMRQAKGGTTKSGLGQIVDAVSIRERPAEVEDRAVPGHWEGDLLSGANNTHIATLVERHTRFAMLLEVPSKDTATVVAALGKHVRKLPQELRRSLTWDRGKEMADHKSFTIATNVQVYFCATMSASCLLHPDKRTLIIGFCTSALGHVRTSCRFIGSPRRCRCSYRRRPRCRARESANPRRRPLYRQYFRSSG